MQKIEIKELTFAYDGKVVLDNINMTINSGDFILLCGKSGCGKTTLLRHLKPSLSPLGIKSGKIFWDKENIDNLNFRTQSAKIAYVMQDPDDQIAADKVWHELAFGLESLGLESDEIRRKVAETASYFDMKELYQKNVSELSGGQKQLLCVASAMTLNPELIVLDEPTSRLDPIAASEFISTLGRINRELGTTVIISEHRPEDSFAYANKVAVLEDGKLTAFDSPKAVGKILYERGSSCFLTMPSAMRIYAGIGYGECPITIKEGRDWLKEYSCSHEVTGTAPERIPSVGNNILLSAKELEYRYSTLKEFTVKGLNIELRQGEIYAMLGSNGSGKTTALKLLSGIFYPSQGNVSKKGKTALLPQDPKLLLTKDKVGDEADFSPELVSLCKLGDLLDRHPYTLSGGEQQRVALAKVLSTKPDILLLDEPTKGLDAAFRLTLANILTKLKQNTAILMVSHDTEFCAAYADRCGLFFDGGIVSEGTPREFFGKMKYFTPPTVRIAHDISNAVTPNGLILACGGHPLTECTEEMSEKVIEKVYVTPKIPIWRKIFGGIFSLSALISFVAALKYSDFTNQNGFEVGDLKFSIIFILSLALTAIFLGKKSNPSNELSQRRKLSKQTFISLTISLILIPLTVIFGLKLPGRAYYLTSLLVIAECILPFFVGFEKKRPTAREIARTASLCALGIAGRAAFFMLPQFKPVLAITIISGMNYGSETGFLVGAMTMLVSNILFSQGPWTPWQMFAMGLCGLLSGLIFRKRPSKISLCIFGGIAAVAVYGVIMNLSSAVIWQNDLNIEIILSYLITGLPMDCVHAAATMLFLWLLGDKKFIS